MRGGASLRFAIVDIVSFTSQFVGAALAFARRDHVLPTTPLMANTATVGTTHSDGRRLYA